MVADEVLLDSHEQHLVRRTRGRGRVRRLGVRRVGCSRLKSTLSSDACPSLAPSGLCARR